MTPTTNPLWQSRCLPQETARDGAERFVREAFGCERDIRWGGEPGEFRFADGYWQYRISFNGGHWQVHRLEKKTARGKAYSRARRKGGPPS